MKHNWNISMLQQAARLNMIDGSLHKHFFLKAISITDNG